MNDLEVMHSSQSVEWCSPPEIVIPMRNTMGGIDLDPASCALSERIIMAAESYDADDNGFVQEWYGRVFLNPPGGLCDELGQRVIKARTDRQTGKRIEGCRVTGECGLPPGHEHEGVQAAAKAWWCKLAVAWQADQVEQAWFVGFNADILQTTIELGEEGIPTALDFPLVWPKTRVPYLKPSDDGKRLVPGPQPPRPSVLIYLAKATRRKELDRRLGWGGSDMQHLVACFEDRSKWKIRL